MNLEQIKSAVSQGLTVCYQNNSYTVVDGGKAGLLIKHSAGSCIGLTWADDVTLNGKEEDLFITGVDLFKHDELLPAELSAVFNSYNAGDELSYTELENLLKDVQQLGYTFEYYLTAEIFDLRKIGQPTNYPD